MKASAHNQQQLLALQDLDTHIAKLDRQLTQLPERREATEITESIAKLRPEFITAKRGTDELETEIARVEADLDLVRSRKNRDESRLTGTVSSKEAQALQEEIDALNRRRDLLESKQLELMEQLETAEARYQNARTQMDSAEEQLDRVNERAAEATQKIESERKTVSAERERLAAEIPADLTALYEKLRTRIGVGAARLRENVSEASNMAISPAELSELLRAEPDELIFCPHTGAILVRESS